MLPEIAAEVLRFLSRRDLDKACAVSKWLDARIAQCFEVYPLRRVFKVALHPCEDFTPAVLIKEDLFSSTLRRFSSMCEAVNFAASMIRRRSYVEELMLGVADMDNKMALFPYHWTTLIDAIRSGGVRRLECNSVDFSELDDDAFQAVGGCPGLRSLVVLGSILTSDFTTDDLISSTVANGALVLRFSGNESDTPHRLSDEAVLDFFFPADAVPGGQRRILELESAGVNEKFLGKFIERLRTSTVRPSGSLKLYGAAKQRGLSAFAPYLAPDRMCPLSVTYRFPSIEDTEEAYEVDLCEHFGIMHVTFYPALRHL